MNPWIATALLAGSAIAESVADAVPAGGAHSSTLLHLLFSFGLVGVFLVSIVDSSFVPLPLPGITDIMIVVLAAQHTNLFLLVGLATLGSALGGLFSHKVGQAGGMAFLEKHVPARILKRVCAWMESHAILAVALPAVLPPPMPLSPFVLASGALNMSRRTFMTTFTASRFVRHSAAAAIGVFYGASVLHLWSTFTREYGEPILIGLWAVIFIFCGIAFWKLYSTSRSFKKPGPARQLPHQDEPAATAARVA